MNRKYLDTGRKNQKIKTRNRILASAQSFLAKGSDFTLEDIAQHSGLSRATIYRYYSNVEILSGEAGLDLNIKDPEEVYESLKHLEAEDVIKGVQAYFNQITLDNEPAFRKYLSSVIASPSHSNKRGARRKKTLKYFFDKGKMNLTKSKKENLANIATILMGMEALIVAKDVCRLNNERSLKLLEWGFKMILRGMFSQQYE